MLWTSSCLRSDGMPGVDFQAVRSMVSMQQVLELLGFVPTTARGHQVYGDCPVHHCSNRRRRLFSANLRKNSDRCFGCGFEAATDICKQKNAEVPWIHRW